MIRFSLSSLRTRSVLIVLLATIPASGLILWNAGEQRRTAALEAEASALRLAQTASNNQERVMKVAHGLLSAVAQLPQVRQRDSQGCSTLFANLLKQYRGYANLVAVEPSGKVFCSGQPLPGSVNFADRDWFRHAVESRELATGEYSIGRITGRPIVVLAYPVIGTSGQTEAVLSIALDLAWLNELAARTRLPAATTLAVIDRKGTVLVRFPDPEKWVGKSMAGTLLFQTILKRGEGTAEALGMDGIARLYGFSPLGTGGEAYVSVGITKDVAFSTANFILRRNLAALGVVSALAILAAWFGSDLFILRRVNALASLSKRLAAGDLSARAGLSKGQDELSELARVFDQMAASIEQFISERRQSTQALKAGYEKLQTLKEINRSILSSLDLKTILEGILEKTVTLGLFDVGVICLIDSSGKFLEPVAIRGLDPEHVHSKSTDLRDTRIEDILLQVISGKHAYLIEDLSKIDGMKTLKREGIQSAVLVPVRIENQVLGTIQLGSRTGRKFSADEIDFLEALGSQMGIAVQNARLFSETKQNLERIRTLSEINLAITSNLDLHAVLNVLMEKIDVFLPYTAVLVWLFDRESGLLEQTACWNLPEEEWKGRKLKGAPPLVKEAVKSKAPVVVANVQTDPRTMDPDFYRRHELVSYLGIPMLGKGEVLGVLVFLTRKAHEFTDEEIEFLTTLAGQAAISIHNSQLYERSKSQAVELEKANKDLKRHGEIQELLKEISQDVTSLNLDTLLKKLTEKVREVLKVDVADVRLRTNEMWQIMGVAGIDSQLLQSSSTETARGRSKWIVKNRRPLIIPDIEQEKDSLTGSVLSGLGLRGYLGVPLFSRGDKVAGVLRALTYQPREFSQEEVNLLQQLANGAAIALDNARQLQEMTAKNKEIESVNIRLGQLLAEQNALREIFTGINLLDLDALLRQLAEHAAKLLSADHVVVRLLNKQGALETVALVGESAESLRDQVLISGTRRSTWVIENRRPLAIGDISQDKLFGPGHLMRAMGVKGYLCFPLISRDRKPIGTFQVTTLIEREFQQDEMILAQQFASVAAIAIENARLYEEVQQKSQELEDAFKAKTAFLNTMAHELRTPLNVMVGTHQLILDGGYGELSEEANKGLEVIGRQAFTMVQLINEILDLARVEARGVPSDVDNFSIEEILVDLQSDFAPLVKEKGLNLEMKVDNPPLRLNTNKQKMKEILQNLLLNAVKYTDRGEIKVRACALFGAPESGDKGGRLCITIEDTGIGISEIDLPYIFDPFYMVQGVDRRKYPSTGLGLTIVKRLVELLHGDVCVESKLGKGSTFSVLLPVLLPTESN